jgi:hypothetical protein
MTCEGKQTILSNAHPKTSSTIPTTNAASAGVGGLSLAASNATTTTGPNNSASPMTAAQSANTPCRFFNLGQCNKGNQCPFLHKKAAHFSPQACKFYINGFCRNADACPFSHDPKILVEMNSSSKDASLSNTSIVDDLVDLHDEGNEAALSSEFVSTPNSFDSSSFVTGTFNDPFHGDDSGSYHDTHEVYSRDSSSFEDDGGLLLHNNSGTMDGNGSFLQTGTSQKQQQQHHHHHHQQQQFPVGGEPFSLYGSSSGSILSQSSSITDRQLHQLIHPSSATSPRRILSRRSSSEYTSSSSYSSASASISSDSSPPPSLVTSPLLHSMQPSSSSLTSSGSLKLGRAHITSTTFTLSNPIVGPTPPSTTQTPIPRSPSYSPLPGDGGSASASASASGSTAVGGGGAEPIPSKPAPFRRQSSAQLSSSSSLLFGGSANNSNMSMSHNSTGIGGGSTSIAPQPVRHSPPAPVAFGGRPAPLNRSRSTDHAIVPPRRAERTLMGLYVSEEEPINTTPTATFFSRVPPLPPFSHQTSSMSVSSDQLFASSSSSSHVVDDFASAGNITPSSTSSMHDQTPMLLISPRSRQSIVSSNGGGGGRHTGATSYFGDFDSFSELGTSDEDDVMFWDNPNWSSVGTVGVGGVGSALLMSGKNLGTSMLPMASVHHRVIEDLLDEDDDGGGGVHMIPSSQNSSTSHTSESIAKVSASPSTVSSSTSIPANRRASLIGSNPLTSPTNPSQLTSPNRNYPVLQSSSSTLSPSTSRSSFHPPGGPPIPMLSRTRKGSFSKSHEDLLANRESPLPSPLYSSPSMSNGFGFSLSTTSTTTMNTTTMNTTTMNTTTSTSASTTNQQHQEEMIMPSSTFQQHQHQQHQHQHHQQQQVPPSPTKRAIPPMLGSLKSQSSVRLVMPSNSSSISSYGGGSGNASGNASAVGGMGPPGPSGRIPPKISKIGKSQSETGPASQMTLSILAWKERKEAAAAIASLNLNLPKSSGNAMIDTPSSSQQASPSSTSSRKQQLCMFFIEGACRYGDNCKFVHGLVCTLCKKPCLFPEDLQQNEKHAKTCRLKLEIEESKDLACALCKLKVVENNRKFGLLPDCNDVICVPCLKEHRTSTSKAECPVCQAPSHFLIPSHSFPQNPDRKSELTEAFKLKMSKISCKYFDHGNGVCKYGQHCHFHHNVEPGTNSSNQSANGAATVPTAPSIEENGSVITQLPLTKPITESVPEEDSNIEDN